MVAVFGSESNPNDVVFAEELFLILHKKNDGLNI